MVKTYPYSKFDENLLPRLGYRAQHNSQSQFKGPQNRYI